MKAARSAIVSLVLALASASGLEAADARLDHVLNLGGMRELLPPGTRAHRLRRSDVPTLMKAAACRRGEGWVVAGLVAVPPSGCKLVVARTVAGRLERLLEVESPASDAHELTLDQCGPGRTLVAAVHWTDPGHPREGRLEVWALPGSEGPVRALATATEGFYFDDVDGVGHGQLVLYRPEPGSSTRLPQVLDWDGWRLTARPGRHARLDGRLLEEGADLVRAFVEDAPPGPTPRIVLDAALLSARLLERGGRKREALGAYARLVELADRNGGTQGEGGDQDVACRRDRAAEARLRAASLAGIAPQRPEGDGAASGQ